MNAWTRSLRGSRWLVYLALSACAAEEGSGSAADQTSAVDSMQSEGGTSVDVDGTEVGSANDDASMGDGDADMTGSMPCSYPEGAVEPMALDAVISPYAWPEARRADGLTTSLGLTSAYCDDDAVIDWSPHEVLVFISIPAW